MAEGCLRIEQINQEARNIMSIIDRLASSLGRPDEVPNQILAREISESDDADAVQELVRNIFHPDRGIQGDCIKVLYEIGLLKPEMIADEVDGFIDALNSKNNRVVWGAMTALGEIAHLKADEIWRYIDDITRTIENGSVITQDWGIRVVAKVAAGAPDREAYLMPFLLRFLEHCDKKDMSRHAESLLVMMTPDNRDDFVALLEKRTPGLSPAQTTRVTRLIRKIKAIQ
jgi:hypothetical protein